ncbi:SCP2 sterol-binding domain-containing protein [Streptomyces sp. HUAS TT20]|uniref:SCP2 sterol-binding domain-containing protein n=1 Tax=Streptomyces sp. HUAS TT20 TaxID=3447509 RepID=UPI0021D92B74|nr:SCP2 sterol-binding domain-containing protein [Streptomyces sp. HUAS 15-9]UXY32351.1 SCP2 sterol-binding domain-containing protein [Streptomyces sp. HUAS 15-9]
MTAGPTFSPKRLAQLRSGTLSEVRAALAGLPREELAAWLATPDGEDVLRTVFEQMPERYTGGPMDGPQTARWEVARPPADTVAYDLVLTEDTCDVRETGISGAPAVTLALDAVSFVQMASAAAQGMDLLLGGRLHIQGDVHLAMRMESFFGLAEPGEPG